MSKATLPDIDELNHIQAEWMKLDSTGPKAEIDRVLTLMKRYPRVYVSGHDGVGVCMLDGMPCTIERPFGEALAQCQAYGGRTDIAWNGLKGAWYSIV